MSYTIHHHLCRNVSHALIPFNTPLLYSIATPAQGPACDLIQIVFLDDVQASIEHAEAVLMRAIES